MRPTPYMTKPLDAPALIARLTNDDRRALLEQAGMAMLA